MTLPSQQLVIAAIDFLNPAPLMWNFEHEPCASKLADRYSIISSTPAECARHLRAGTADIGLVPVAAYPSLTNAAIVPRCAIASLDEVRSILLVVSHPDGVHGVRRVALDTASITSATYTRVLFRKLWKNDPEFLSHAADLDAMLCVADAALLIGDPALLALEDRESREDRTGKRLLYIDLAHEWRAWTNTAWVSAFWAVRKDALDRTGVSPDQLVRDFEDSRDGGLDHLDDIVREWTTRIALPAATIKTYLFENIHYFLDDVCLNGLELFYRYAVECGALSEAPVLQFL
ncbi:MAG TPA: menaquinone biosynthesis protein [Silvibacterium sp.]|nr:menaquinone biosynthesis protein [Silvibacterium sp.]